jgi:hypothetical protein
MIYHDLPRKNLVYHSKESWRSTMGCSAKARLSLMAAGRNHQVSWVSTLGWPKKQMIGWPNQFSKEW